MAGRLQRRMIVLHFKLRLVVLHDGVLSTEVDCFAETLKASQRRYVLQNPGLELHPAVEALVILVSHLADEMLLRAILLIGIHSSSNIAQSSSIPSCKCNRPCNSCIGDLQSPDALCCLLWQSMQAPFLAL